MSEFIQYLPFATIFISTLGLGLAIIKNQSENRDSLTKLLEEHEEKDEQRYIEVLRRFEKVSVALARLGSTNGTYEGK